MTDFLLPENINKMIKCMNKPRLFYKKGISVGGLFRPYMSCSEYTTASIFSGSEVITPVTIRFSAMLGYESSPDTNRNIKKMEVRFFTLKGSYDMLCQNIPVQFINDEKKLLNLFDAFKIKDNFDGINKEKFWYFVAQNHEALNATLNLYSSQGLNDSFININWYSVNLTKWINLYDDNFLIKMRWVPITTETYNKILSINSAQFMAGFDPDVAHNQLIRMIKGKQFPKLELQIQVISDRSIIGDTIYDPTILWDEIEFPYIPVGVLLINKLINYNDNNEICYLANNTVEGIKLINNGITDAMDLMYKFESLERGIII